jgi:23S rRNA (cytidine2498-2'-O)-methyltransferase
MLLTCQTGFEALLARELAELHGAVPAESGSGWVRLPPTPAPAGTAAAATGLPDGSLAALAFPHLTLIAPAEIRGDSVNALAARIAEFFLGSLGSERIEGNWPCLWLGPSEVVGLGRRIGGVESAFGVLLKKRMSRLARLAVLDLPRDVRFGPVRGLFIYFTDFGRAWVARDAFVHGPRRMADDELAPSRSYLKVEEAYVVLEREPQPNETVCDLGAAPGGWSYSAAKRGARVIAIDNGPLKGGALDHPQIEHRREDAFKFLPPGDTAAGAAPGFDWLFCDMVEEPHHVLRHIVEPWLARRGCRHFIVNLKFGRVDPIGLLAELRAPDSPLTRHAPRTRIRHLFHDREELTLVGEVG